MKKLLLITALLLAPCAAFAAHVSVGVGIGVPAPGYYGYGPGYYYAPGYYPSYYYAPPTVVYTTPTVVQAEPAPVGPPSGPAYWYWCAPANAYYPAVGTCPEAWQTVPAQAAANPQPAQ